MWDKAVNSDMPSESHSSTTIAQKLRKGLALVQGALTHGFDQDIHGVDRRVLQLKYMPRC